MLTNPGRVYWENLVVSVLTRGLDVDQRPFLQFKTCKIIQLFCQYAVYSYICSLLLNNYTFILLFYNANSI